MRQQFIPSVLFVGLSAIPAFAGFTTTTTVQNLAGPLTRISIAVQNNGMGGVFGNGINTFDGLDGVRVRAVVGTSTGLAKRFRFATADYIGGNGLGDGVIDTLDLFNSQSTTLYSYVRAYVAANTYTGIHPYPIVVENNPWQYGSNYLEAAVVQTGNNPDANSSPGYTAILLLVEDGAPVNVSGAFGGNDGPQVNFTLNNINGTYTNGAPYLEIDRYYIDTAPGGSFSFAGDAIDPDNQTVTTSVIGLPSFATLVATPNAPAEFTIENNRPLTPADVGEYTFVVRATDPGGAYSETEMAVRIQAIPEPISLMMLSGFGFAALRRRRP